MSLSNEIFDHFLVEHILLIFKRILPNELLAWEVLVEDEGSSSGKVCLGMRRWFFGFNIQTDGPPFLYFLLL